MSKRAAWHVFARMFGQMAAVLRDLIKAGILYSGCSPVASNSSPPWHMILFSAEIVALHLRASIQIRSPFPATAHTMFVSSTTLQVCGMLCWPRRKARDRGRIYWRNCQGCQMCIVENSLGLSRQTTHLHSKACWRSKRNTKRMMNLTYLPLMTQVSRRPSTFKSPHFRNFLITSPVSQTP